MGKSAFKAFKGIDGVATYISGTTYPIGNIREKDLIFYKSKVFTSSSFVPSEWDLVGESNTGGLNGLSKVGTNVELGGTLTGDTNVGSGNYAIAFGDGITILDGVVNFDDALIANKIMLYTVPAVGTTSQILTRNPSSGLIEYVNKESLATTPSEPVDSIQFNNSGFFSGSSNFTYSGSTKSVTLGTRLGNSGLYSFSQGKDIFAGGSYSHAEGHGTCASGITSHAEGYVTRAYGNHSHAEGCETKAYGNCSHVEGVLSCSYGIGSHAQGYRTKSCGTSSHSGGYGVLNCEVCALGFASFNHSFNGGGQIIGHGAMANSSAILGGCNHNIESGNVRAAIIGGNAIKLTGTTYCDTTAVGNLAIFETPSTGSIDDVLVWDTNDKVVKKLPQSSLNVVNTSSLTDSTSIAFDFESKQLAIKTLTTTNTSITLTLSNIVAGANQILSVIKNTTSTVTMTLAGTGLNFYGYDSADYNTTPDIILSGVSGNYYDISFLARTATDIGVAVGYNGN